MSNTTRYVIAILASLAGSLFSFFVLIAGSFSTIACQQVPPDWIYYLLFASAAITLAGSVAPAVMLVRKAKPAWIALVLVIGIILSCSGYTIYLMALGNSC